MTSPDLRALGRLGSTAGGRGRRSRSRTVTRRVGGATVATRRPRVSRTLLLLLGAVAAVLVYLGVAAAGQVDTAAQIAALPAQPATTVADGPRRELPRAARDERATEDASVFATVDGLRLRLPHASPVAIAFHEATQAEALALTPQGRLEANDNPTKFAPVTDSPGPAYRVLSSRGRARPAASAVDIVVPDGDVVTSPVTGKVVEVRQYALYGGLHDWRVVIEPRDRPDLHVVLIHLHEPAVAVGDAVVAGTSGVAVARLLPFDSHVDYVVGERHPHVHLEVKPATAPRPLDPNEPAVEPAERLEAIVDPAHRGS